MKQHPGVSHPHPVMATGFLKDQVAPFFHHRHLYLDAFATHGSALYVLESRILKERADRFRSVFEACLPKTAFYYAFKSNSLPEISHILIGKGFGLDVSSGMELAAALELGAQNIIFSGPGKTDQELEMAIAHKDRVTLLLDSIGECRRLMNLLKNKKQSLSAGIRLNCNPTGLWQKFGIMPDQLLPLYREIQVHPFLRCTGLQFHSSWNLTPDRQQDFILSLGLLLQDMPDNFLRDCKYIDIGGGYWPETGEWLVSDDPLCHYHIPAAPLEIFAKKISAALAEHVLPLTSARICFEPGRWLCHDAMHIIIQVIDKKAKDLVITDAGTNAVGWERYETDYFPVLNLTRPSLTERPCRILGSLCTPHDVWGYAFFGKDIKEGDILMIPFQGAYTYSLRQTFIKPLPRVLVL
ncbi:MAG: decarboxylase [Desulfobacteraceae bacterium]|nr:decarboxylase [Desulfobacteraceae bacterium]